MQGKSVELPRNILALKVLYSTVQYIHSTHANMASRKRVASSRRTVPILTSTLGRFSLALTRVLNLLT